jgi:hypothetical protein
MEPRKNAIAICGRGGLGLITEDTPKLIHFENGDKRVCWVGIYLTEKPGSFWCSSEPTVVGHLDDIVFSNNLLL